MRRAECVVDKRFAQCSEPAREAQHVAYLNRAGFTPVGTHAEFNILNYRRENRRFILGKVIHYRDQDLVTIEFSAGARCRLGDREYP